MRHAARAILLLTTAAAVMVAGGCGDEPPAASPTTETTTGAPGRGVVVRLADKNFTESAVVAAVYARALTAQGFRVVASRMPRTEVAYAAVRRGDIDVYPDYDGTLFQTVQGRDPREATGDPDAVLAMVRRTAAADGVTVLGASAFGNDNQVACTVTAVEAHRIRDLDALGRASPRLTYSATRQHLTRADGLPLLRRVYGVRFARTLAGEVADRYTPIRQRRADCVYAFATDPQLARLPLVVIKDTRGDFVGRVPHRAVPVVNQAWRDGLTAPQRDAFDRALARVNRHLTQEVMPRLIARVEFDGRSPQAVAARFVARIPADDAGATLP